MSFSFSVIREPKKAERLLKDWEHLHDRNGGFFYQDWRWYLPLMNHKLPNIELITGYNKGQLILILPITYQPHQGILSLPVCLHTDLIDCLVDQALNQELLAKRLQLFLNKTYPKWRRLENARLLSGSHCWRLFEAFKMKTHLDAFAKNSFFATNNEQNHQAVAASAYKHADKHERKLKRKSNAIAFGYIEKQPMAIERFFVLEDASWKGSGGKNTSILADQDTLAFYKSVASHFGETNQLRIFACEDAETLIAAKFAIASQQRLFLLKTAYLPDYAKYSPGNIIIAKLLEASNEAKDVHEVNLITGPPWADRWMPQSQPLYWGTVYRSSATGQLEYFKQRLKDRIRPMKNRIQQATGIIAERRLINRVPLKSKIFS